MRALFSPVLANPDSQGSLFWNFDKVPGWNNLSKKLHSQHHVHTEIIAHIMINAQTEVKKR